MKICDLRTTILSAPFKKATYWPYGKWEGMTVVLVEVLTDEGIIGLGESVCLSTPAEGYDAFIQGCKSLLIGESPFNTERLLKKLEGLGGWVFARHFAGYALGGIEMALWDIVGKAANLPLYKLWGGKVREGMDCMKYVPYGSPEEMADEAQLAVAAGYKTIYCKYSTLEHLRDAIAAIREAVGEKPALWVDFNQTLSPGTAVTFLRTMEKYRIDIVEQPVLAGNLDALAYVRSRVHSKILAHESSWTMQEALNVVKRDAADIISLEPRMSWGILGAKKVAGIAEAAGLPVAMHSTAEMGLAMTAFTHLAVTLPNMIGPNQQMYDWYEKDYLTEPVAFKDGKLLPPEGPGLGVELDREVVAELHQNYKRNGSYPLAGVDEENMTRVGVPLWPSH